jgi:hypothetical protein
MAVRGTALEAGVARGLALLAAAAAAGAGVGDNLELASPPRSMFVSS